MRWTVEYPEEYRSQPGRAPRGPIGSLPSLAEARPAVESFLKREYPKIIRPASGRIAFPYFIPGSTYEDLWDWDAFFIAAAAPDEYLDGCKGSICNLLDETLPSGRPPKRMRPDGGYVYDAFPLPIHAQFLLMVTQRCGSSGWAEPLWKRLVSIRKWYETETRREGFYVWTGFRGNGLDNNPTVYGRPPGTSAGVDLAVWHWMENRCMARIAETMNKGNREGYLAEAERIAQQIRSVYWDPSDRFFYSVDRNLDMGQTSRQKITWPVHLKFRNFAGLFPVIMGVASAEQAGAVFNRLLDPDEFLSPAGIRSHSARDGVYNNVPMEDPSNWQGPVWALTTCLCSYGLALYGRPNEAREVAGRLVSTFAADLRDNGCLHEYYCGDTGQPLSKPGFLSWNLLAGRILDDLESGCFPFINEKDRE